MPTLPVAGPCPSLLTHHSQCVSQPLPMLQGRGYLRQNSPWETRHSNISNIRNGAFTSSVLHAHTIRRMYDYVFLSFQCVKYCWLAQQTLHSNYAECHTVT
jgi:hypothetical protein